MMVAFLMWDCRFKHNHDCNIDVSLDVSLFDFSDLLTPRLPPKLWHMTGIQHSTKA
jgi:hypothetical protein